MKFLRWLIMAFGLGIIFCLIATITPVDKTPLNESRYYQLAQQKLDSLNSSYLVFAEQVGYIDFHLAVFYLPE